ncbi:hypothetical protein SAMN06298221_11919 [Sphaerochaeta associata]|uniref:hypothetical protein n=1 Tax=Sphaerochaeta associata TaxID=1129264 RepID=UPI000E04DE49|nr:hypothetical protein [Sphaerochaeta associata]SMP65388.1 hypothetical protein SAMN06298221_11919 [Sphaerochaeta associata]
METDSLKTTEQIQKIAEVLLSTSNEVLAKLFMYADEEPLKVETAEEFMIVSEILYKVSAKVVELKEYNSIYGNESEEG